jgi:hypothetical protein
MSGIGTAAVTIFIILVCLFAIYEWWNSLNDKQRILVIGVIIVAVIVLIFGP